MPRRKSVNPYDLNAISEADHPNRKPRSRNPRDENPYSLTKERNLRGVPVELRVPTTPPIERRHKMINVVLYKSNDQKMSRAIQEALEGDNFLVVEVSLPGGLHNDGPSPVAHFCGKGVAFGQKGIISFAKWLIQEETHTVHPSE